MRNLDFDGFYPILLANKKKHNVKPTHSLEELKKLAELFPENIKLLMLYKDGNPIVDEEKMMGKSSIFWELEFLEDMGIIVWDYPEYCWINLGFS